MTKPGVRSGLPWLRSGPLYRVHNDAEGLLDDFVREQGYQRIDLDGRLMTSRAAAHRAIGTAFGFPDWYGNSWDAFDDCLGGFVVENDGGLFAVVWHHVDAMANAAPATTTEVGWALLLAAFGEMPSLPPSVPARIDLDVFVLGAGDDFDRP